MTYYQANQETAPRKTAGGSDSQDVPREAWWKHGSRKAWRTGMASIHIPAGSFLLHARFLQLQQAGAALQLRWAGVSCCGFSCCSVGHNSSAAVHRLNRFAASGILPDQGSRLCPLQWQVDSWPLDHQGSSPSNTYCSTGLLARSFLILVYLAIS